MDWDFLNIFKKAEFNTLMLSVAITGWILYFCISTNIYILGTAILSSAYCIIRLVVYTYQYYSLKRENRRYEIQKKKEEEEKEKRYENNKNIEITRMFEGLSDSNKFILASILLKGKKINSTPIFSILTSIVTKLLQYIWQNLFLQFIEIVWGLVSLL